MKSTVCILSFCFCLISMPFLIGAEAKDKVSGEHLFQQHCASCHFGGGNKIKSGRNVAGSKQLSSLPTFKAYLSSPPGHMPHYQNLVSNPKLLKALYDYCKTLKAAPVKQATRLDSGSDTEASHPDIGIISEQVCFDCEENHHCP